MTGHFYIYIHDGPEVTVPYMSVDKVYVYEHHAYPYIAGCSSRSLETFVEHLWCYEHDGDFHSRS